MAARVRGTLLVKYLKRCIGRKLNLDWIERWRSKGHVARKVSETLHRKERILERKENEWKEGTDGVKI